MTKLLSVLFILIISIQINCLEWNLLHHITSTSTLDDKLTKLESDLNYKPEINIDLFQINDILIDTELSYDINLRFVRFENSGNRKDNELELTSKLYRGWLRYSTSQTELRIGLQKINFGPAQILRSLQWFDNINPYVPTKTTEGVKAVLGRYYFINNANIWLWGIWGDSEETSINKFFYEEDNFELHCSPAAFRYFYYLFSKYGGPGRRFDSS